MKNKDSEIFKPVGSLEENIGLIEMGKGVEEGRISRIRRIERPRNQFFPTLHRSIDYYGKYSF